MIEIDAIEPRHNADEAANQRGTGENLRFSEAGNGRLGPQFAPHSVFCAPSILPPLLSIRVYRQVYTLQLASPPRRLIFCYPPHSRAALSHVGAG